MVLDSERHHAEIISYIKDKHKRLFSRRHTQQLENRTLSRYSIFLNGTKEIIQTTDLRAPGRKEGRCPELLQNLLEVRGIGLLDIRAIFGETAPAASHSWSCG